MRRVLEKFDGRRMDAGDDDSRIAQQNPLAFAATRRVSPLHRGPDVMMSLGSDVRLRHRPSIGLDTVL